MKIISLIKIVPKVMKFDRVEKRIIRSEDSMFNPNDLIALGNAIALKKEYNAELLTVNMAPPQYKSLLSELFDFGVDKVYLLSDRAFGNSDVFATAHIISGFIKKFVDDFQYILGGLFSSDGLTGALGGEIAEALHISYFSNVIEMHKNNDRLSIIKESGDRILEIDISGRAFLSVSPMSNIVALPSLYEAFREKERKIEVFTNEDLGLDINAIGRNGSKTVVQDVFEIERAVNAVNLVSVGGAELIKSVIKEFV